MKRNRIRSTGLEWLLVKRSDRTNVSIKYRTNPREDWQWGSSGVPTKRQARKLAPGLIQGWLTDKSRECKAWSAFRTKYETEKLEDAKAKTAEAFRTAADRLAAVSPVKFVQDLDDAHFEKFAIKLRKGGSSTETIRAYRDHLWSALKWAKQMKIIPEVPERPVIKGKPSQARSRALTREEAERGAMKLPKVVGKDCANRWAWNLEALWRSGFRIGETFAFTWEESNFHFVYDLNGRRPMIAIAATHEKGGQMRLLPMAPDFVALLRDVPKRKRTGQVFRWPGMRGKDVTQATVEKRIAEAGRLANVVVGADSAGEARYAAAHDWRRAFGSRWAPKVMPAVLQVMMRHKSIRTTMKYYVGQNAILNADALWSAVENDTDFGDRLGDTLDSLYERLN